MTEYRASRQETLARLAQSRAEIRRILERPPHVAHAAARPNSDGSLQSGQFPRSRTMRLLMSGRAMGTVGAVIGGLALARPALAFRFLRMLPTGAVARMLLVKAITSFRARN